MTKEYPETAQEFASRFATEEACRQYLFDIRWGDAFVCPSCSHTEAWQQRRGVFRCAHCRRDVSVTAGTLFHGSRLSLRTWFQAAWCMVSQKHGVSALGLSHVLGITRYETVLHLVRTIRTGMVRPERERLTGVVEVDEVYLGGLRKGRKGRSAFGRTLVVVAVEEKQTGIGRIRIRAVPDASRHSLVVAITAMVEPGSVIRTDQWQGYWGIAKHGYRHRVIKKRSLEPGEDPTPLVHRIASLLKRVLLGTHQGRVHAQHLQGHLDEFVFRFNRRASRSRGKLFFRLVQNMVAIHR